MAWIVEIKSSPLALAGHQQRAIANSWVVANRKLSNFAAAKQRSTPSKPLIYADCSLSLAYPLFQS